MNLKSFRVDTPQPVIDDLHERLARTRWPSEISNSGWEYGTNLGYIKELAEYWLTRYDWRAQEEAINKFKHFRAEIDGLNIHFIHERGQGPKSFPMIITHGWPGSFAEMLKILPLLTDPASHGGNSADSFDVIIPSLPGYGFSDHPTSAGMNTFRIAEIWQKLMHGLGYDSFGAQGGDWGANVTTLLGFLFPTNLAGIHLNYIPGSYRPYLGPGERPLSVNEQKFVKQREQWYQDEGGYAHIQATMPQTLAYGLNDSPTGLAAWIVEKFRSWGDCNGNIESRFTKDELLTNIMIYWITGSGASSIQLYRESLQKPLHFKQGERITVPCGIARFPKEAPAPPRDWIERCYNIQHWSEMPSGGHFAAMEEPQLLAADIRDFFRGMRG